MWAIKKLNFDFKAAKEDRLLQLNELEELRIEAYDLTTAAAIILNDSFLLS